MWNALKTRKKDFVVVSARYRWMSPGWPVCPGTPRTAQKPSPQPSMITVIGNAACSG